MRRLSLSTCMLVCAGVTALSGCVPHAPKQPQIDVHLPNQFTGDSSPSQSESAARVPWDEFFSDPHLTALLRQAIATNPDVPLALTRVEMARAYVTAATGAQLPRVGVAAGAGIRKFGLYTMDGAGNATTEITPGQIVPTHLPDFSVGLVASWEVDVWGKLKNQKRSVVAQYLASVEAAQWVLSQLVRHVASAYYELLAADASQRILTESLQRQQEALEVVRLQKQAGTATELAVQQFLQGVSDTEAQLAEVGQRIGIAQNQLNLLLGRYPHTITRDPERLFGEADKPLDVGVPAALLRNRPDVRQAELELKAARCDVAAARAAFHPELTITAGLGLQAFNPRYLFDVPSSFTYNAGAGLIAPLVNRAAIEADFSVANARQTEALYNYQKILLQAYADVVNGLLGIDSAREVLRLKAQQKAATSEAVEISTTLFQAGKATYFEVLLAQQSRLSAELDRVQAAKALRVARVDVYSALGGGTLPQKAANLSSQAP